jgi:hypothetical protein
MHTDQWDLRKRRGVFKEEKVCMDQPGTLWRALPEFIRVTNPTHPTSPSLLQTH